MSRAYTDAELVKAMAQLAKRLGTIVDVYGQVGSLESLPGPDMLRAVAAANERLAEGLRARATQLDPLVIDGELADQVPARAGR